jgi:arsenate reductase
MKILFLCTHNSCRSILSEALFNHMAPKGCTAYSAGSFPSGEVNPLTLEALIRAGVSTAGFRSKSSDEFEHLEPDIVITVCDKAAGEACPLYLGRAVRAHWGLNDPSELARGDAALNTDEVATAFDECMEIIRQRIDTMLALPLEVLALNRDQLQAALNGIGEL